MSDLKDNPFTALFGGAGATEAYLNGRRAQATEVKKPDAHEILQLSYTLEKVFLVTLDKDGLPDPARPGCCVFLSELHSSLDNQDWLDFENVAQALFERTLLVTSDLNKNKLITNKVPKKTPGVLEARTFYYLCQCYCRANTVRNEDYAQKCRSIILECANTCLQQPDLYPDDVVKQMTNLFFEEHFAGDANVILGFLEATFTKVYNSSDMLVLCSVLYPVLSRLHQTLIKGCLGQICFDNDASSCIQMLDFFSRTQVLGEVLLAYTNTTSRSAVTYEKSLLGCVFSSSIAPNIFSQSELFTDPSKMTRPELDRAENLAFSNSERIANQIADLFLKLIKISPRTRHLVLSWVGEVLHVNKGRPKLASTMSIQGATPQDECSDGFMLNLCMVLLKLCQPFCQPASPRLLRIRPEYARKEYKEINDQETHQHHSLGLPEETFLVPLSENDLDQLEFPSDYSFICDLYFLTQQALYLGFHATFERFIHLNRDLNRLQGLYQQIQSGTVTGMPNTEVIKVMFENNMKRFLAMKTALIDPSLLKPVLRFHVASSTFLTHLACGGDNTIPFTKLTLPITNTSTTLLGCMPEYAITNITDAMMVTRRFKDTYLEEVVDFTGHLMDLVLVFMGSSERVRNPHLRAKLAEVLAELMPKQDDTSMSMQLSDLVKGMLFSQHPNIEHLAEVLFTVFVSIETTGESVEFEQKLNYRQPMYRVIDYIWKIDLHRKAIKRLAEEALENIEATRPPLFLKFVNLLVNDANFLLDEALDFMRQIKEKMAETEARAEPLVGQEAQQAEANLSQMTMLARFHNMAAVDTSHTLSLLTTDCSQLFCHSVMVDRIAAMLNYFLLKLTGPKMSEFKVKDFDKYEFKPSRIVSSICTIYTNLASSDSFCASIPADGRSYSPSLFPQAERVLRKINAPINQIQAFSDFSQKIKHLEKQQSVEDDLVSIAPEEFIDPIMGSLMLDPVILPSSHMIVDKSTIARHILSDQTDPFNRSPLSLDQVKPDGQLRQRIEEWKTAQIRARNE